MRGRPPGKRELDARAARLAAGDLLSRRAWTRHDLAARLRRRGAPPEVADAVVEDLVGRGYVDDAAFARHWIETRAARGYGAGRLRAELFARGVAAPIVDRALAGLAGDHAVTTARAAALKRLPALRRGDPERVGPRLYDYLLRRGYAPSVATRVVRDVAGHAEEAPD
ncbi:MAG: regulatory protein RecX [Candidatus Rokubacteria bacterium]|nr:regulatory protein RecX [Candidatus Rokubacteria bacterium]